MTDFTEDIFKVQDNRFTLFPLKYSKMYEFFKQHESNFWTAQEISLSDDVKQWENDLNEDERFFIKNILAFFAGSDGIVNENIILNLYQKIQIPESRCYYTMQMMIESVHSETYSILIETFIKNNDEKEKLFNAIHTIPWVQKKAQWSIDYMNDDNIIKQLFAFIIVEGLFFSGSFCALFWLKNRGLMPGLTFSNELIARDENMHTEYGIYIYSLIKNKLSEKLAKKIMKEAVDIEKNFVCNSIPVSLIGMNNELMSTYIEYVSDNLMVKMGYKPIFNIKKCPFNFMELLSFSGKNSKVNFFEKKNSDYQKANIGNANDLVFDEDF